MESCEPLNDEADMLLGHLEKLYTSSMLEIINNKENHLYSHKIVTHSLYISSNRLFDEYPALLYLLKLDPILFFEKLQDSVTKLYRICMRKNDSHNHRIISPTANLQIVGRLNNFNEQNSESTSFNENSSIFTISTMIPKSHDINQFKIIKGMVVKISPVKVYACQQTYICCKCKHVIVVKSSNIIRLKAQKPPSICTSNNENGCNSTKFALLASSNINRNSIIDDQISSTCSDELYVDYQEIKIQEQPSESNIHRRCIPRSMWAIIQHDHVDKCQPGDNVVLYGVIVPRYKSTVIGDRCVVELVMIVNNMVVNEEKGNDTINYNFSNDQRNKNLQNYINFWKFHYIKPLNGREVILSSFCPQLYGVFHIRLVVLLSIIGGVPLFDDNTGTRTRSESHILIVGDPGTGKSQLLKWACKLVRRSVFTTGTGSTSAGLTASVVRDTSGEYSLEAGALPLSDGGICCIDEFNCIREKDLVCIHEAMEQQSISVAKAGVVAQLRTRSSIIAAANAKGGKYYNCDLSITENLDIASALLSRFDLVMVIKDPYNDDNWNRKLSSHILEKAKNKNETFSYEDTYDNNFNHIKPWDSNKLRTYIDIVKPLTPIFSTESALLLKIYYIHIRDDIHNVVDASRRTLRLLQSLIRLATSHAKLMMHKNITLSDSIMAIILMEISLYNITPNYISMLTKDGIFMQSQEAHNENFQDTFVSEASNILEKLDLGQLIPFLLCQDEVFSEIDLIHDNNNPARLNDIQTQYIKTIPNIQDSTNWKEFDIFNDQEDQMLRDLHIPNGKIDSTTNNTMLENYEEFISDDITQKYSFPSELEQQWEGIDDDEIFGDL